MAKNPFLAGQTGEFDKAVDLRCPRCPEASRPHRGTVLADGRLRLVCVTCGYETFVSADDAKKPVEIWLTELDAAHRFGQHGKVGTGQVVFPATVLARPSSRWRLRA